MVTVINDHRLEERLREDRRARGLDHHDEVWEGVYMMAPLPGNEHQEIVGRLASILDFVVGWPGLGKVYPGVNLAGLAEDWEYDYRAPDVVVFLAGTRAVSHESHWRGGADFVIEVLSPGDRSREKLPFYSRIGVRELLVVDRKPWAVELYRWEEGGLKLAGRSTLAHGDTLASQVVPLRLRLVSGDPRPRIEVVHPESGRTWMV